jgi:DNA (cytosine-5)-methyltransferase 1
MKPLRLLDTFSGIGGFSLAAKWVGGFQTVQFVEIEPYCQKVLAHHWPSVPIHNDITTFYPELGFCDVITGGFPCQDVSNAGKQAGIKIGTRSGLFYELMRVVRAIRPQFVILENVAAITSNGLGTVLGELAEAGYDTEWACISAADVGACHNRERAWIVGCSRNSAGNAGVSLLRDSANSRSLDLERRWPARQRITKASGRSRRALWRYQGSLLSPDWRTYLSEPVLRRGDDGLSSRVHRLKALGNSVVPQVAMIPLARVIQLAQLNP